MSVTGDYWEQIYTSKPSTQVSWFQREPAVSLRLITAHSSPASSIVDVGAGTSYLADRLMAVGYEDVTLVDVSAHALHEVKERFETASKSPTLVQCDILNWMPSDTYDVWHDRAVFHFLIDPRDRARYIERVATAVGPGGVLILGVFASDGPTLCSGLAVRRYDAEDLRECFGEFFTLESHEREVHVTPTGAKQKFTWAVLRRGT